MMTMKKCSKTFADGPLLWSHLVAFFINLVVTMTAFTSSFSKSPSFQLHQRTVLVSVGERANLKCRVDNLGDKTITWKRMNDVHPLTIGLQPFLIDPRIRVDHNQRLNEWNLVISEVVDEDEGVYQCQISTKDNFEAYNITLKLKRVHLGGKELVELGQPISLQCKASNFRGQPSRITWFKDDVMLQSVNDVRISDDLHGNALVSQLHVRRSNREDGGVYRCMTSEMESDSMLVRVRHDPPTLASNLFPEVLRMSSGANHNNLISIISMRWQHSAKMLISIQPFMFYVCLFISFVISLQILM